MSIYQHHQVLEKTGLGLQKKTAENTSLVENGPLLDISFSLVTHTLFEFHHE